MGLFSLHNHVSQFLLINLCVKKKKWGICGLLSLLWAGTRFLHHFAFREFLLLWNFCPQRRKCSAWILTISCLKSPLGDMNPKQSLLGRWRKDKGLSSVASSGRQGACRPYLVGVTELSPCLVKRPRMTSVIIPAGSFPRGGQISASPSADPGNHCVLRKNKLESRLRRQKPKISKRITVTRGQSRSENQVIFGSNFDPGPNRVSTWVTLSKGMEPFDMYMYSFYVLFC